MGASPPTGDGALTRAWLVRAAQLGLTVLVTWLILDRVGLTLQAVTDLEAGAWIPEPFLFGAASLLLLLGYFVSAALWGRIVADLGGPRLSVPDAVRLFMIANLGRYVPGKVWQIAGLAALGRRHGIPATTGAGAAVLGQGIALVAATMIGVGALLTGPERFRAWGIGAALVVVGLVALGAVPAVFRSVSRVWFRVSRTEPPDALGTVHGFRWLALYLFNWALYAVAFWVLVLSLDAPGALLPVASAFAASYVLGYVVVFAPAGLGPREAFLIAILTPHFGVSHSSVIAVVARLWTTLVEVVPAGAFWARHLATAEAGEGGDE